MPSGRRTFNRLSKGLTRKKKFVLSVEGRKTEQEYFNLFKEKGSLVTVLCLRSSSRSSPTDVLQRMKKHLKKEPLEGSDEAWLVVDYDQWPPEHFYKLHAWTQQKDKCFLAVSNPKFEYWLLLHFEDGRGVATPKECDTRLKKHLPNYSKGITGTDFTQEQIADAVRRATSRDNPPCEDWPHEPGKTTVYILVKHILKALDEQKRD